MNAFRILLLIFGLTLVHSAQAKKDTTLIYCNKDLKKASKKRAYYYAKVYMQKDGKYGVQQFNYLNVPVMTGSFLDKTLKIKQGDFSYFDYDGNLEKTGTYDSNIGTGVWKYYADNGAVVAIGNYVNNERNGEWNFFNDEGKKKERTEYKAGKFHGKHFQWHNDTLITLGQYDRDEKTGDWQRWFDNGRVDSKGSYINGKRNGEWKFYFDSGEVSALEMYENGKPTKVEWFDKEGKSVEPKDPLEQDPSFPGGNQAMSQFIAENVQYPELAREMGEQGIIYVAYTIEQDGTLSDIRIRKGVSMSLDKEALRVVKLMPKWLPSINHGRNTTVDFTFPIHFRLG